MERSSVAITEKAQEVIYWLQTFDIGECSDWELYRDELLHAGKIVHRGSPEEHRWYTLYTVVVELHGRFVEMTDWTHKSESQGDTDVFGDDPPWESVRFVTPTEKVVTVYI